MRERVLRSIFESVSDAVFVTTDDGRILDANHVACALTGRSLDQLHAARLDDVLPASRVLDVRTVVVAPDLLVHTGRDLTEQRRLEMELRHSQKLDALGRLVGGVSHDFNNVITAISAYAELLLAKLSENDSRRDDVGEIRGAAHRAAALTKQLLALSRKQQLDPQAVDLNTVITDIARLIDRLIGPDVEMVLRLGTGLWPVVADAGELGQVLMNLAVNARDAMPHGGLLTMGTRNVELGEPRPHRHGMLPSGAYVVLEVTDSGHGMSEEVMQHLFEPFFTTKKPGHGTGLGLSTAYGVVRQSGGHILVDSAEERGTRFCIYLPRAERPTAAPLSSRRRLRSTVR
jgi:two-component system cell cycle sensor histidine kinase/response regulator CckA